MKIKLVLLLGALFSGCGEEGSPLVPPTDSGPPPSQPDFQSDGQLTEQPLSPKQPPKETTETDAEELLKEIDRTASQVQWLRATLTEYTEYHNAEAELVASMERELKALLESPAAPSVQELKSREINERLNAAREKKLKYASDLNMLDAARRKAIAERDALVALKDEEAVPTVLPFGPVDEEISRLKERYRSAEEGPWSQRESESRNPYDDKLSARAWVNYFVRKSALSPSSVQLSLPEDFRTSIDRFERNGYAYFRVSGIISAKNAFGVRISDTYTGWVREIKGADQFDLLYLRIGEDSFGRAPKF